MSKIKKITDAQKARLAEIKDEWIAHGLSVEPANWVLAEEGIRESYETVGMDPPRFVFRARSPIEAIAMRKAVPFVLALPGTQVSDQVQGQVYAQVQGQVLDQVRNQVDTQVYAQVGAQVRAQVYGQVLDQVLDQVYNQVYAQVSAQVRGQVQDQVGNQVEAQVRDQVHDQVGTQVRNQVDTQVRAQVQGQVYDQVDAQVSGFRWYQMIGGNLWAGYISWAVGCRELGADIPAISGFEKIGRSAGWWWPHQGWAVVSDRPELLKRDAEGRLHCENGPAIQWRDGWGLAVWHGTRIPMEWVTKPEELNAADALTWENIEQRRCLAEIVGWAKVLEALGAEVIDKDDDPEIGTLIEAVIPDSGRERFLQVQCGTGRTFALPVPPEMKTALEANAWTYGLDEGDLRVEVRT